MFGNFSKMKFVDTNLSNARLRDVAFRNLTAREGRAMASGRSGRLATALDARARRARVPRAARAPAGCLFESKKKKTSTKNTKKTPGDRW